MCSQGVDLPSIVVSLMVFPHQTSLMPWYESAKKIMIVANAVPVSSAAQSRSTSAWLRSAFGLRETAGQRGLTIVALPPRERSAADGEVEHEADDEPERVLSARCGRDVAGGVEEDRHVDVAQPGARPSSVAEINQDGDERAYTGRL